MKKIHLQWVPSFGEGTVADMLDMAGKHVAKATGFLLAESPKQVIFRPWETGLTEEEARACQSIIIFGTEAEVRFEKLTGSTQGMLRCLCHAEAGEEYFMREEGYALRSDVGLKGRLLHAEYFREHASGMLELCCARLMGISQGERS